MYHLGRAASTVVSVMCVAGRTTQDDMGYLLRLGVLSRTGWVG